MDKDELTRISKQIDVLKKKAYEMLKALNHLGKEISEAEMSASKMLSEYVMDMPDGHKLHVYIKDGKYFDSKFV